VRAIACDHWARGGAGAENLAREAVALIERRGARFRTLYPDDMPLAGKIATVAREIYRAVDVTFAPAAERRLRQLEAAGHGKLPVCIAKTQYSFSADPTLHGAPDGHHLPVRDVKLCAGAGFVVALAGDIMTMPGLPRVPAAERIRLRADGEIEGLD
jgi:formate--tetrahydrofolate ligase